MKKIIILLISINMISHSMDQHILTNKDVIKEFTKCLHIQNHYYTDKSGNTLKHTHKEDIIESFGKDVRSLKCTHSSFNNYYSDEKNAQEIIRNLTLSHQTQDSYVISLLVKEYIPNNFETNNSDKKEEILYIIGKKIDYFFEIAAKPDAQFTQDDLKNSWYMNATIMATHGWIKQIAPKSEKKYVTGYVYTSSGRIPIVTLKSKTPPKNNSLECFSLLSTAYKRKQLDKMRLLIEHGSDATQRINSRLLINIAKKRAKKADENNRKLYLDIAKLLLENKAEPDIHTLPKYPTALMIAVYNKDKEYAKLLLQHKADPYKTAEYPWKEKEINAFEMETTGWLKEMVDDIITTSDKK